MDPFPGPALEKSIPEIHDRISSRSPGLRPNRRPEVRIATPQDGEDREKSGGMGVKPSTLTVNSLATSIRQHGSFVGWNNPSESVGESTI